MLPVLTRYQDKQDSEEQLYFRSKSIRKRKRVMSRSGRVGFGGYFYYDQSGGYK
jgi:hypothetical protein